MHCSRPPCPNYPPPAVLCPLRPLFNGGPENVAVPTGDGLLTAEPVSVDDYATMRVDVEPNAVEDGDTEPFPPAGDATDDTEPPVDTTPE